MDSRSQRSEAQMTSQEHAQRIAHMLQSAQKECRADINRVDDPKAQALFETVAEVLGGTMQALNHYSGGTERVWQSSRNASQSGPSSPTFPDTSVDVDAAEPPPPLTDV